MREKPHELFIQFINYKWYILHEKKALGTLPENGNVTPKHVGATINN
jgi:hypothetical protein